MLAKITLYPDNSAQESYLEAIKFVLPNEVRNWQLVADNLTTGKMIDLLMCLEELGFLSADADADRVS